MKIHAWQGKSQYFAFPFVRTAVKQGNNNNWGQTLANYAEINFLGGQFFNFFGSSRFVGVNILGINSPPQILGSKFWGLKFFWVNIFWMYNVLEVKSFEGVDNIWRIKLNWYKLKLSHGKLSWDKLRLNYGKIGFWEIQNF